MWVKSMQPPVTTNASFFPLQFLSSFPRTNCGGRQTHISIGKVQSSSRDFGKWLSRCNRGAIVKSWRKGQRHHHHHHHLRLRRRFEFQSSHLCRHHYSSFFFRVASSLADAVVVLLLSLGFFFFFEAACTCSSI